MIAIPLLSAFERIAPALHMPADELFDFAGEDFVGGYHTIRGDGKWSPGSVWGVEGEFLYALVRALKPERVIEIGTWRGCSASHILEALHANGKGELISVDMQRHPEGIDIPKHLLYRWKFVEEEAVAYITRERPAAELVFEDADHTYPGSVALLTAIDFFVKPRVLVSHDACHPAHRDNVVAAWDLVFKKDYDTALILPSDCGLAWKVFAT